MPLVLDIFGVVLLQEGLNIRLLEMCAAWRRDGEQVYGASNMTAQHNTELWQQPGIRDAFDEIYCSGVLGVAKPEPVFYTAVAQKIGAAPSQLIFFDDNGTNVAAADASGWEAYIFSDNRDLQTAIDGFFQRQRLRDDDLDVLARSADNSDDGATAGDAHEPAV